MIAAKGTQVDANQPNTTTHAQLLNRGTYPQNVIGAEDRGRGASRLGNLSTLRCLKFAFAEVGAAGASSQNSLIAINAASVTTAVTRP